MREIVNWERKLRPGANDHLKSPDSSTDTTETISDEDLLPCHYFDYMYGTSTGGLIATMLGRLRMSVPQCLEIYREVGESLFGRQRSRIPLTTKYHAKPLMHAVRDIVRAHCKQHVDGDCDGDDWHPWDLDVQTRAGVDFDHHICQSICLTAVHNGKIDEAHLLRTYDHRYVDIPNWITPYNEGAEKLKVWEVTRATSAAPFYFDNLEADIEGKGRWTFKDGGIRENNPSGAAWSEFISLYGENKDPAVMLSVGTGRPDESQDGFATTWPGPFGNAPLMKKAAEKFAVFKNVLIKYTDGEEKHKDMLNTARGEFTWYKRLNVSSGLENMPLDSWKKGTWTDPSTGMDRIMTGGQTLSRMEKATIAYLERDIDKRFDTYASPKIMLSQTAEKLVRQRLARLAETKKGGNEKDKKRWDTFTGRYMTGEYADQPDGPLLHPVKKNS